MGTKNDRRNSINKFNRLSRRGEGMVEAQGINGMLFVWTGFDLSEILAWNVNKNLLKYFLALALYIFDFFLL